MKRLGAVLGTVALAAAPLAVAAPASADTENCVSRLEFKKVQKGWSMKRVHRVFDVGGKQYYFYSGYQGREYRACQSPEYSIVNVDYVKKAGVWRVESKFAYWV